MTSPAPRTAPLHYESLGEGPPLLVLGGIHLDHRYLRPWMDPLSSAAEVIYLDHRGVGRSPGGRHGDGRGEGRSPAAGGTGEEEGGLAGVDHGTWAADVVALADHLGHERFRLFGHSYGGFLALETALRHPGRVEALVLCATAASMSHMETAMENAGARGTPRQLEVLGEVLGGPLSDDAALRDAWITVLPLYFHRWRPEYEAAFGSGVSYSAAAYSRAFFGCLPGFDLRGRLAEIQAPALVVSGRHDWIMPPGAAGVPLTEGLGAEHVVFEESGHFPFMEEGDAFLGSVGGWLRGLAPGSQTPRREGG